MIPLDFHGERTNEKQVRDPGIMNRDALLLANSDEGLQSRQNIAGSSYFNYARTTLFEITGLSVQLRGAPSL
jgi:hypothetical protein